MMYISPDFHGMRPLDPLDPLDPWICLLLDDDKALQNKNGEIDKPNLKQNMAKDLRVMLTPD